ncbi:MAG: aldo/keto reductase [Candidatus Poribacteria bacterium]
MRYKELGKTGLKVSEISFGASPLGEEYGAIEPAEGERAVHYAIDNGISYFDVAPYYGGRLAETRLGQALIGRRDSIILATKMGRYKVGNAEEFDFSADRVRSSLEESMRCLKTDYIDVYQAHDIEFTHRDQIINETLPAMYQLKQEGKVGFVGITGYPLRLLRDVAEKAEVDTILTYCRYNLMDTSMDEVLTPLCREKGIGLINASPLHMRVLSQRGAPAWHPAPKIVLQTARKVTLYCLRRGVDISELAMQFALANERVSTTLVGMSKAPHVARNLETLKVPLDCKLIEEVLNIIKPVANTCWQEGIPENFDPGAVPQQS